MLTGDRTSRAPAVSGFVSVGSGVVAKGGSRESRARELMAERRVEKLPLVDSAGLLDGLITMRDIAHLDLYPLATKDARGRLPELWRSSAGPRQRRRAGRCAQD